VVVSRLKTTKYLEALNLSTDTLALLIDGDNASPKVISGLLAEIATYGTASVKRIYGDWTKPNLNGWKECLLEHSIQPEPPRVCRRPSGLSYAAMAGSSSMA
jgi:hypothetical protein